MNTIVKFYEAVDDSLLKFAVVAKSNGKWVFCKHKERDTYECPARSGGDRSDILDTRSRYGRH